MLPWSKPPPSSSQIWSSGHIAVELQTRNPQAALAPLRLETKLLKLWRLWQVDEPAEFEQVKAVTVRRYLLEKWVGEPFFESTLTGCMVRISIGLKRDTREPEYILCRIVEFIDRDPGPYR